LAREPKELRRAIALEAWGNRHAVKALEEISSREMLVELVDYALRYRASMKNLCTKVIPRARIPLTSLSSPSPAVIRFAMVSGGLRAKMIKIRLRLARLSNGWILDRDMVGALNIGLRALSSDGRGVAFPSTEPHGVWVKLVNPHQGLAQTSEIRLIKSV